MTTIRRPSAAVAPIVRALLARPRPDPVGQALRVVDLAGMCAERLDLALERRRDVDPGVAPVRPEEVDPADLVGRQPAPVEPRERHRVPRRRVDRVDRGDPGGSMVGVVDPAALVDDRLGVGGEDGVRSEGPDLADELLAQGEVVGEGAVGLVEEADPGVADDRRGRPLLGLAQGQRGRAGRRRDPRRPGRRWCSTPASPPTRRRSSARPSRPARTRRRRDARR